MSLALVHSRARAGVDAPLVRVEVHLSGGLPVTQIVGLAETSVRESRERVRAALLCARFDFPQRRITLNLAPADLPKEGGRYDLAIALGILAASGQVDPQSLLQYEFLGELGLTGELRPVAGALPAAIAAAEAGRILVVPPGNAAEAALAEHADVRVARTLLECCAGLGNPRLLPPVERVDTTPLPLPDLADVRGQAHARRALEVAAAGGHHLLLIGSPGCGKTLLASRLPSLLPDTEETEALQLAAIASVSGEGLDPRRWRQRPSGHRTTVRVLQRWWVAAIHPVPARSRWPITACCFWTSFRSGTEVRWKPCVNRWNPATSASPARHAACSIRRDSSWWRR